MKKIYSIIKWDNVTTIDDFKLILKALHGTLGFAKENPHYNELKDSGMLGEETSVEVPDEPPK
jgi:hypothetical protein